ncbi:MAG: oligoribonuclease [Actinomycetota bacterium]|nr:oligoribonuclease [Actinomycetota bacterium]
MDQPLVWVDLEMTGLDPERDAVLEIATVVTDAALERVVEGPDLVIAQPEDVLARMEPVVADMHVKSGLVEAVRREGIPLAEAQRRTLAFVRAQVPEAGSAPLAGNSIHADRMFLRRHLPELEAWLHYRNVDVSTVKELARRWHPAVYEAAPAKSGGHRALADIRESIAELRHYRDRLFH